MSELTKEQIAVLERMALPGVLVGTKWRTELTTVEFTDEQTAAVYEIYTALSGYSAPRATPTTTVWADTPAIFDALMRISTTRALITQSLQATLESETAIDALLDMQRVAALTTLDVRAQRLADVYFTARTEQDALVAVLRYEQATHDLAVAAAAIYNPAKDNLCYAPSDKAATHVLSTAKLRVVDDEGVARELPPPKVGGTGLVRRALGGFLSMQLFWLYSISFTIGATLAEVIQAWLTEGGKVNLPFGIEPMSAKDFYQNRYSMMRAQQKQLGEPITCGYANVSRLPWLTQMFGDFGLGYYGVLDPTSIRACVPKIEPAIITKLYQDIGMAVQTYIAEEMYGQTDLTTMNAVKSGVVFTIVTAISKLLSVFLLSALFHVTLQIAIASVGGLVRGAGGVFRAVGAADRDL